MLDLALPKPLSPQGLFISSVTRQLASVSSQYPAPFQIVEYLLLGLSRGFLSSIHEKLMTGILLYRLCIIRMEMRRHTTNETSYAPQQQDQIPQPRCPAPGLRHQPEVAAVTPQKAQGQQTWLLTAQHPRLLRPSASEAAHHLPGRQRRRR